MARICSLMVLLVLLILPVVSSHAVDRVIDPPRDVFIESAVYDVRMGEEGFDGFCMITLSRHVRLKDMTVYSDSFVEVVTNGFVIDSGEGILRIGGLGSEDEMVPGGSRRIILRFRGDYSNGSVRLPVLDFPYVIDKSLISVSCSKDASCSPGFIARQFDEEGLMLASEDVGKEAVGRLDSDLLQLRSLTTKVVSTPSYRFYLGWTSSQRKLDVDCSPGGGGVHVDRPLLLVLAGAFIVLIGVYGYGRRVRSEKMREGSPPVEAGSDSPPTAEKLALWEKSMGSLAGDEREVYSLIIDSGGRMLQKDICEMTGFSKARVSRLIDRLEGRGLLYREPHGITRRIVLK